MGYEGLPSSHPPRDESAGGTPSMATGGVDRAVLAPYHEVVNVTKGEGHGGDSHSFGLLKHQLQAVLWGGRGGYHIPVNLWQDQDTQAYTVTQGTAE